MGIRAVHRKLNVLIVFSMWCVIIPWTLWAQSGEKNGPPIVAHQVLAPDTDLRTAIVRIADATIPSVVHIEVTQRQEVLNPFFPFENDPFFRYFFDAPGTPKKYKRELKGLGTGMIMDSRGYILTNNHVVAGATEIEVLLSDGNTHTASLVGTDPKTDLAVITITAGKPLPHVTFGDSDALKVGEWVVAIGHPRGLDHTVTQGIISAKHRRGITDPTSYQDFLQTDAAINPGNSGGPLLNLEGKVIGVNAAIASESGGFEGIGFAIPSNMALYVAQALISRGKVERGWLGVSAQDVTPEMAKSFGVDKPRGAVIADVVKGGPADKAGIVRGDVIIAYQGREIYDSHALRNEIAATPVGHTASVSVLRDGKRQEVTVIIGSLQDMTATQSASARERLGAILRALTPQEAQKYRIRSQRGVVLSGLDPGGPLAAVGFETGDMILEIDGQPIESVEQFLELVNSYPSGRQITLLALDHRTGRTGHVQVTIR